MQRSADAFESVYGHSFIGNQFLFKKIKRFADKWTSGGFDTEEPLDSVTRPWRVFGVLMATLLIVWLVWFGLGKYFYAQDTKEFDIPNPIKAVPADSEFYAQKRKVKPGLWILTTEAMYGHLNRGQAGLASLEDTTKHQYLPRLYERLFYKPKPFIDGGWFQSSVYSAPLEGLKYCRIGFARKDYVGWIEGKKLDFNFEPAEEPCLQPKDFGGSFPIPAYIYSKDKNIFYLNFTGYLQAHVNSYDDFKAYIYRCQKLPNAVATCKLIGYDQDSQDLQEQFEDKARKDGSLAPLRLWN